MTIQIESIVWDGSSLSTVVSLENRRVTCTIPREAVHAVSIYGDVVSRDISRNRPDIFERVKGLLEAKIKEIPTSRESIHVHFAPCDFAPCDFAPAVSNGAVRLPDC
jgi:hypothetical protein